MKQRVAIAGSLGVLLGLSLIAAAALSDGAEQTPAPQVGRGIPNNEPCGGGGQESSVATAIDSVPYPLLVPSDKLASGESIKTVWLCPGTEVEEVFDSGIKVYLDANTIFDPADAWKAMAADSPSDTTVGEVLGQPAALITPKDGTNGSVSVVSNDIWIVVEGNGTVPIEELVRVADSLAPAAGSKTG